MATDRHHRLDCACSDVRVVIGLAGLETQIGGVMANTFWGCYNVYNLWPIVRAATYQPPPNWEAHPPDFLFPDRQATSPSTT